MLKRTILMLLVLLVLGCKSDSSQPEEIDLKQYEKPSLNTQRANHLYHFAYDCIDREYPNKLNQVLGDSTYLKTPAELHPTFYGCFDWHSSVHGHWTLLTIIKNVPDFEYNEEIMRKLKVNFTKEKILKEVAYFEDDHNKNFERTYGWAWLLKVAEVLRDMDSDDAKVLSENLRPLEELIVSKYLEFLPKLNYPIRVGEHPNTAFGMSFAYDYAEKFNPELEALLKEKAIAYFSNDQGCPITWEPGGFDFLSPCLQEASLMMKVLPNEVYVRWLDDFLPGFRKEPSKYLQVAEVTDRSDGKLAHLDGLNFSRAWCLYEIGNELQNNAMIQLANKHFDFSYTKMDSGEYAGAHWLASFALYAISKSN